MLSLYSCCSVFALCYYVVFCRVQPIFNHHYKGMIYLFPCSCAVACVLRWINTYYLCAVSVFVPGSVRYVWILFKCGSILKLLYSLIQSLMFRAL